MLLGRRYPVIDLISRGKQRAMPINYRPSQLSDVPAMAAIRAADWGTEEYWRERITQYLMGTLHPKDGLPPRVSVVALENERGGADFGGMSLHPTNISRDFVGVAGDRPLAALESRGQGLGGGREG